MKCPLDLSPDTFKRESITDPREKGCWRGSLKEGDMAELGRGKAREKVDGEQRRRAALPHPSVPNSFTVSVRDWACLSHFQSILNAVALLILLNHCSLLITPLIKSKKCPLLPAKSNLGFSASPALTSGMRRFPACPARSPTAPNRRLFSSRPDSSLFPTQMEPILPLRSAGTVLPGENIVPLPSTQPPSLTLRAYVQPPLFYKYSPLGILQFSLMSLFSVSSDVLADV